MKMIDFYKKKREMHNEMIKCINELMVKSEEKELDLSEYDAYIIISPDGYDSTAETRVLRITFENGRSYLEVDLQRGDKLPLSSTTIIYATLESLYETVYKIVNHGE